ncbi:hypothetical protein ICM05_05295 [Leucobacter sp. cx-42]|uniref:hypothetical protein n=1 Tax=unclassified Leucobacter TaxID=2621730 RepID=UPI00165E056C|nr:MULTISPECIES: hypothetical protein [unclassified Leucobacter]MBC9954061.1 hypothetical protein [Leucobacter sp. cx-42]
MDPTIETQFVPCGFYGNTSSISFPTTATSCGKVPWKNICPPLPDRSPVGWVQIYKNGWNSLGNPTIKLIGERCVYPSDPVVESRKSVAKIYTGGQGDFRHSLSTVTAQTLGEGTVTSTTGYVSRGVNLSSPEKWAGSWTPSFTARTGTKPSGDPLYGYYSLQWRLDYRGCEKWGYPSWVEHTPRWDCGQSGYDTILTPYTYACDSIPPLKEGLRAGAKFRPADCVSSLWECGVEGKIKVAGQSGPLTVMRNGDPVTVVFPALKITGEAVKAVRGEEVRVSLTDGATPLNPQNRDPNSKNQFFDASWKWDKWEAKKPSTLRFHWASDPGHPFSFTAKNRFTGDFRVQQQDTINSSPVTVWASDQASCGSSHSPEVSVLRAVSRDD